MHGKSAGGGGGEDNTGANVGSGTGLVFRDKTGVIINFKTLLQGSNITLTDNADDITIAATGGGEVNTSSNVGTGVGLAKAKNVFDLPFRSIINSSKISWTENTDDIVATIVADSLVNADINSAAAIAYSKLNLATSIVNSDIAVAAAIAYSKLNLALSIVNADIAVGAAIAYSKLNLSNAVVNADIAAGAAILQNKLAALVVGDLPNLPVLGTLPASPRQLNIVNSEIDAGAAILQSKLAALVVGDLPNLPTLGTLPASPRQVAIVNSEIDAGAAILQSKLAALVIGNLPFGTAFQRIRTNAGATDPEYFTETGALVFILGNGSDAITTGVKVFIRLPYDIEITRWTVLSKDASSDIVVDVNRYTSLANYDSGTKASIAGSDLPTLSNDKANDSTALTGWTTTPVEGEIIEVEVDSITTATRVTVEIKYNKRG